MSERVLYPDEEQRRRIMDFIMAAGQTLLENGAEVFRVEQTMEIMARSFHLREFHVYILTNGIFASAGTAEISEVRNVPVRTTHLGRVAAVNELSRQIAAGGLTLDEAEAQLARAQRIPFPNDWVQLVAGLSGAFCFAMIFGGTLRAGLAAAVAGPFIKGFNSMPRVILAPIFAVWFGLGPASKIALGFTLVFFIVFFNVYQGVREVNPNVLASAKMLGATRRQLLRYVYLPSAMSWVFSSLHTSVGMAFVAAVIGEYLGSAEGVGYLILQAETTFDMNTVMAGILVLTACALILDRIVTEVEKRLMRWQPTV